MRRGEPVKTTVLVLFLTVVIGCGVATAQEPPPTPVVPPPTPVVTPPPAGTPPATTDPAQAASPQPPAPATSSQPKDAPPVVPATVTLTESQARSRREAIFVMEGVLVQHVVLAANATQREIESVQPGLRLSMFSPVPPSARGNYLEDYGVFFHVQIPSYVPSVVQIIEEISRNQFRPPASAAVPTSVAPPRREAPLDPDLFYVGAVREYLISAMLEQSKSLDLRPSEWLTVSARGDDGGPSQLSQPSIMLLRVKGSDLMEYLAGRISKAEVTKRVEVKGFSGSR